MPAEVEARQTGICRWARPARRGGRARNRRYRNPYLFRSRRGVGADRPCREQRAAGRARRCPQSDDRQLRNRRRHRGLCPCDPYGCRAHHRAGADGVIVGGAGGSAGHLHPGGDLGSEGARPQRGLADASRPCTERRSSTCCAPTRLALDGKRIGRRGGSCRQRRLRRGGYSRPCRAGEFTGRPGPIDAAIRATAESRSGAPHAVRGPAFHAVRSVDQNGGSRSHATGTDARSASSKERRRWSRR